jgi:molybdate transport system ATP-binding protein
LRAGVAATLPTGDGLVARVRIRRGGFALEADLDAPRGTTAILGPNGAGKSTLVAALAGLVPLSAGSVALNGRVWEDPASGIRLPPRERRLGVAFQAPCLLPWIDVLDNVAYGPRARGARVAEARARATEWLERLSAGHLAARRPAGLSGGEAQRVALARALAADPALLLLDEPISSQDVAARGVARRALGAALADFGGVALIVSHDPIDALTLADRVIVLEDGRVVQQGDAESLRRRPATAWVATLAGVNLLRGRLVPAGTETALACGELRLTVLPGGQAAGSDVAAVVPPRAIALSIEPPTGSARNVIAGTVRSIDARADRVRVTLDTNPPLTAEITRESLAGLGIAEGVRLHAAIKVTEIEILPG